MFNYRKHVNPRSSNAVTYLLFMYAIQIYYSTSSLASCFMHLPIQKKIKYVPKSLHSIDSLNGAGYYPQKPLSGVILRNMGQQISIF